MNIESLLTRLIIELPPIAAAAPKIIRWASRRGASRGGNEMNGEKVEVGGKSSHDPMAVKCLRKSATGSLPFDTDAGIGKSLKNGGMALVREATRAPRTAFRRLSRSS